MSKWLPLITDNIPEQLKSLPNWVLWKAIYEDGKDKKRPHTVFGNLAETNNQRTWTSFQTVLSAYDIAQKWDGISFVLSKEVGIVGVDIDDCILPDGKIEKTALEIITCLDSYSEFSPSGQGIRIFCFGNLPQGRRKVGNLEIYDTNKALTVTGNVIQKDRFRTMQNRHAQCQIVHKKFFQGSAPAPIQINPLTDWKNKSDDERIAIAITWKTSTFGQLWLSGYPAGCDRSSIDLALCNHLAYLLDNDYHRIDYQFRRSKCYRSKWDEKHRNDGATYGQLTIETAISGCVQTHTQRLEQNSIKQIPIKNSGIVPVSLSKTIPINERILQPGGVLQALMDYIDANSAASIPLFALGASLSFLGSIMGQKFMTQTGLRTNLYCLALGYSGSGKNAPFHTLIQLLDKTYAREILGPSEVSSAAAIISALCDQPNLWLPIDEIAQILAGIKNPRAPEATIPRALIQLFSSTDRPTSKRLAREKQTIVWSHLGLFGTTTPEKFWDSITSTETSDGFLARLLIWESLHDAPYPKHVLKSEIPSYLIDTINTIYDTPITWDKSSGNLDKFHIPIPNIIPMSEAAGHFHNEKAWKYHELKNKHKQNPNGIASIYGRIAEHAQKISLIHTISAAQSIIQIESMIWAWLVVEHLTSNIVAQLDKNVYDTPVGKLKNKIVKTIVTSSEKNKQKHGYEGATLRDLQRGPGQGVTSKILKELLEDLILAEMIYRKDIIAKNGAPVQIYCAIADID